MAPCMYAHTLGGERTAQAAPMSHAVSAHACACTICLFSCVCAHLCPGVWPWLGVQMLRETGEMLRPILRLGIPESSIMNKLPYARPDMEPLPNRCVRRLACQCSIPCQVGNCSCSAQARCVPMCARVCA